MPAGVTKAPCRVGGGARVPLVIKLSYARANGGTEARYTFPWRGGRALIGSVIGHGHHAKVLRLRDASTGNPLPICLRITAGGLTKSASRNELFGICLQYNHAEKCFGMLHVLQYGTYAPEPPSGHAPENIPADDLSRMFRHSSRSPHECIYCIMPACMGGDMFELTTNPYSLSRLSAEKVMSVVRWFLEVLISLKKNSIIHGDIKPENVCFLRRDKTNQPIIESAALIDFGLSKRVSDKKYGVYSGAGTPAYMAPEVIWNNRNPTARKECSFPVDVYSAGTTLFLFCLDWIHSNHSGASYPGQELYYSYNNSSSATLSTRSFVEERSKSQIAIITDIAKYGNMFPNNHDVSTVARVLVNVVAPMLHLSVLYRPSACNLLKAVISIIHHHHHHRHQGRHHSPRMDSETFLK